MATAPSSILLPRWIDPFRFAYQRVELAAKMPASALERLTSAVESVGGDVAVALRFSVDDNGYRCVDGKVEATVKVICQRCLESMDLTLKGQVNLAIVLAEEDAKQLPKSYDPWLIVGDTGKVDLYEVLEEELLLTLPIVPHHAHECTRQLAMVDGGVSRQQQRGADTASASVAGEKSNNPFKVLEQLKHKSSPDN